MSALGYYYLQKFANSFSPVEPVANRPGIFKKEVFVGKDHSCPARTGIKTDLSCITGYWPYNKLLNSWHQPLNPITVICSHGYLLAELSVLVSEAPLQLHSVDRAAEVIYDYETWTKKEEWYIQGKTLPDFGLAVAEGEGGLAQYVLRNPKLRRLVCVYLREKLPESKLLVSMEASQVLIGS